MASPDRLLALFFRLPNFDKRIFKKSTPLTSEIAIFAGSAPSKKPTFGLQNREKIYVFSTCFWKRYFSSFYTKNVIFGLQLGPQLGVKNL